MHLKRRGNGNFHIGWFSFAIFFPT
jgi:hypothetical protein